MPTLQILGNLGLDVGIRFAEIQRDFGDGHDRNELVGNSQGQLFYSLVFNVLPDRVTHTVTDPEDGDTVKSYANYLWDFFVRRKQDGLPFDITDPRTGLTVSVKFVDTELTYRLFSRKIYSTGLKLKQHRS